MKRSIKRTSRKNNLRKSYRKRTNRKRKYRKRTNRKSKRINLWSRLMKGGSGGVPSPVDAEILYQSPPPVDGAQLSDGSQVKHYLYFTAECSVYLRLTGDKLKIFQLMRHDKIDETGELRKLCQRHVVEHASGGAVGSTMSRRAKLEARIESAKDEGDWDKVAATTAQLAKFKREGVAGEEDTGVDSIMHELVGEISDKYQRYQVKIEKEAEAEKINAGEVAADSGWTWNGIIMNAKIIDIVKVGKKCLDILHSALRTIMETNSEITGETNLEMTAFDYSKDGSLVKAYESIGFINTGRNIFT